MSDYEIELKKEKSKITFGTVSIIEIPNAFDPYKRNIKTDIHGKELSSYFNKTVNASEYKVMLNGKITEDYDYILKPSDTVLYVPIVAGGGGGGKQILSLVALVALTVVSGGIAGGTIGGFATASGSGLLGIGTMAQWAGAGVLLGGSVLVNAVLAPEIPKAKALPTGQQESPTYSWSGIKTQVASGNPIPILYGRHKLGGTVLNNQITYKGQDQYLKTLLSLCHGRIYSIQTDDIIINDEPLSSFIVDEDDAQYFFRGGTFDQSIIPNFDDNIFNNNVNKKLEYDEFLDQPIPYTTTTTSTNIDYFRVHLSFPEGLYFYNAQGKKESRTLSFKIEYKKTGDLTWNTLQTIKKGKFLEYEHLLGSSTDNIWSPFSSPFQYSNTGEFTTLTGRTRATEEENQIIEDEFEVSRTTSQSFSVVKSPIDANGENLRLDLGQYDIRVTCLTSFASQDLTILEDGEYIDNDRARGIPTFSILEEVNTTDFNHGGEALLALDLKATDRLGNNQPNYNIIAERWPLEIIKPDLTTVYMPSNNPAWCCYDLLTNKEYGGGGRISPEDMDYDSFESWATFCDNVEGITRYGNITDTVQISYNDYINTYGGFSRTANYLSFGNFVRGAFCILESLFANDLDYTLESLKKDSGSISFSNQAGQTKVINSADIEKIDRFYDPALGARVIRFFWLGDKDRTTENFLEDSVFFGFGNCNVSFSLDFEKTDYVNSKKLRYNGIIDSLGNVWETANSIGKIGRGQIIQRGTIYSCIFDEPQPGMRLLTDDNFRDIQVSYTDINDIATEVEIQYADKDINYEMTTVNLRDSTLYNTQLVPNKATIQAIGITTQDEALVFGRYLLANNKFVRRSVQGIADIESIAFTVGDVIGVQSSIPQWGVGGTVLEVRGDTLILSHPITSTLGNTYTFKTRKSVDDTIVDYTITDAYNDSDEITIVGHTISEGDIFTFGEQGSETVPFRVVGIDRNTDLDRKVRLVEYNESILDFDVTNDTLRLVNAPEKPKNVLSNFAISESLTADGNGNIKTELNFSWDNTQVATYNIYAQKLDSNNNPIDLKNYLVKGSESNRLTITNDILEELEPYRFTVEQSGTPLIQAKIDYTILGKSIPPEAPQNVIWNSSNGELVLSWKANQDVDFSHYLLKLGNSLQEVKTNNNYYTFKDLKIGAYNVKIYTVDTTGNLSVVTEVAAQVNEPSINQRVTDSYLIEKAFEDGLMTIWFGGADKTLSKDYDIWKVALSTLTVGEYTYASQELKGLTWNDFDATTTFKYKLNGEWFLCNSSQLLVIQRLLKFVNNQAIADGNVRIFNKRPANGQRYDIGDLWIQEDGTVRDCTSSNY